MSTTLRGSRLIDNCTPSISYDRQVQAASEAFDNQMWEIMDDTGQVLFIPNIMALTDPKLVDILAWQFNVDFYDPTRDLEFRKNLVQMSIIWHKSKGTVALVQNVIDTYWPGGATIQEWFEYYDPLPPNYPVVNVDDFLQDFRPQDVNVPNNKFVLATPLANGIAIKFQRGVPANALPTPIVEGTTYYVINYTPTQFQISATLGGSPVVITNRGTGTNEIWIKATAVGSWHDRYRFRISVDQTVISPADEIKVLALIDRYKPISRWCEGIIRPRVSQCNIGWAGAMLRFITRESAQPTNYP
jgi:P2-related tail formation protein